MNKTKKRILDKAERLFITRGYEKTSVNSIIASSGTSKGTFYYYFDSKETVLEEISDRLVDGMRIKMEYIYQNEDLDPIALYNRLFEVLNEFKLENKELVLAVFEYTNKSDNLFLRQKMMQRDLDDFKPLLAGVIEKGIKENAFHCDHPAETAEMFIRMTYTFSETMANIMIDENVENKKKELDFKMRFYESVFEKILGVPDDSLRMYNRKWEQFFKK